jgi:hypothetical protein
VFLGTFSTSNYQWPVLLVLLLDDVLWGMYQWTKCTTGFLHSGINSTSKSIGSIQSRLFETPESNMIPRSFVPLIFLAQMERKQYLRKTLSDIIIGWKRRSK